MLNASKSFATSWKGAEPAALVAAEKRLEKSIPGDEDGEKKKRLRQTVTKLRGARSADRRDAVTATGSSGAPLAVFQVARAVRVGGHGSNFLKF